MNAEEVTAAVDELESKLERLRVLYDQYFVGIEKIPPNIPQKDVDRRIWVLRREKIRNTGVRFKFQTMIQRYNTMMSYWVRIMREIENGTYKRDVMRAKRRFGGDPNKPAEAALIAAPAAAPEQEAEEVIELTVEEDDGADLDELAAEAEAARNLRSARAQPPQRATKPAAPPRPSDPSRAVHPSMPNQIAKKVESDGDLDDMLDEALGDGSLNPSPPKAQPTRSSQPSQLSQPPQRQGSQPQRHPFASQPVRPPVVVVRPEPKAAPAPKPTVEPEYRKVYSQYVDAKRKNGESTAGLTYETLARSLDQTKEKLKGKSGGKAIDFEVAVKDGKTILKPVVR